MKLLGYTSMDNRKAAYSHEATGIGVFSFVAYRNDTDAEVIHPWVNMEYAKFWGLGGSSLADVEAEYRRLMSQEGTSIYLGYFKGAPSFLTEVYDPSRDEVSRHYQAQPGDRGMHVLVAPMQEPIKNFTKAVFVSIMNFIFDFHGAQRVVVEPDIDNVKIHKLNENAGFVVWKDRVQLTSKTARIEICTKEHFHKSKLHSLFGNPGVGEP